MFLLCSWPTADRRPWCFLAFLDGRLSAVYLVAPYLNHMLHVNPDVGGFVVAPLAGRSTLAACDRTFHGGNPELPCRRRASWSPAVFGAVTTRTPITTAKLDLEH